MWRWSVLLFLLFSWHSSSQPVADENRNDRQPRQLDFGECCPCPGAGQTERGFTEPETMVSARESSFSRAGDVELCPCNARQSDSEGAASVFFPTAMRADGSSVRSTEKKEDIKPLLHPEVDLASSVLQTLRDVTEEEYQDALARDAARSVAKAAEEAVFGDATPEASGNVVTIIVTPKDSENEEDFMPQESRIQEPRCIHPSLQNVRTETKMRAASKSPSLLREIFGLPKLGDSDLLRRSAWDRDSNVEASNIQEYTVNLQDEQDIIHDPPKSGPVKNRVGSTFRNLKISPTAKSSTDDDYGGVEISKIKQPGLKLKDLLSERFPLEGKHNVKPLPSLPKMKLGTKARNTEDLKVSPSNIREQETIKKVPYFKTKSHIDDILQKTGPFGLKNLLKLKDVELIPLKDLIRNRATEPVVNKKSKLVLPAILKKDKDMNLTPNNKKSDASEKQKLRNSLPANDELLDPEVSPSQNIENVYVDNCHESTKTRDQSGVENNDNSVDSPESLDNQLNVTIQSDVNNESSDIASSNLENNIDATENNENCDELQTTDTSFPKTTDTTFVEEEQVSNSEERDIDHQEEQQESYQMNSQDNCNLDNIESQDSLTDSSNNINNIVEPSDNIQDGLQDIITNETGDAKDSCSQERKVNDEEEPLNNNDESDLIRPPLLNDTLNSIKENIIKTLESLRIPSSSRISNIFDRKTIDPVDDEELPTDQHENKDKNENCDEGSLSTTTVEPEDTKDDTEIVNEATNSVTMQDLQDKSNSMLQEEEKSLNEKAACGEQFEELSDPKTMSDLNMDKEITRGTEIEDLDISPNNKNEIVINSQNSNNIGNTDEKMTCDSDSSPDKKSSLQDMDSNAEASEVALNRIPCISDIVGSPSTLFERSQQRTNIMDLSEKLLPKSQDFLKLPSLPTFDDLNQGLTDLFDNNPRVAKGQLSPKVDSVTEPLNINPTMITDASTNMLRSKSPLKLEGIDLNKLHLGLPRLEIPKIKPKLPLLEDLNLKPRKLQSSLTGKRNDLGILGLGDFETIPNQLADLSENLHSHAKNNWRSMQKTLQSKLAETTKGTKRLQSPNLLEVISQNHEDVSDKLRALHVDFNDRLESMRNSLIDNSRFISGDTLKASKLKPFNGLSDRRNAKQLSLQSALPKSSSSRRKESKKISTPSRLEKQRKPGTATLKSAINEKKFKMPASASVPVPKTIEVPRLRAASTKYSAPALQKSSGINAPVRNLEVSSKQTSFDRRDQADTNLRKPNTSLGKKISPFKDSKIKVSFSTTPRPLPVSGNFKSSTSQFKNLNTGKGRSVFDQRDTNGLPSEVVSSMISQSGLNLDNSDNEGRQSFRSKEPINLARKPTLGNKEIDRDTASTPLQSWPKASESAFLSKVREAVKARLPKLDPPGKTRQSVERNSLMEVPSSDTDMTRSASTDITVIEKPMKENVSYKCTMMCTKD